MADQSHSENPISIPPKKRPGVGQFVKNAAATAVLTTSIIGGLKPHIEDHTPPNLPNNPKVSAPLPPDHSPHVHLDAPKLGGGIPNEESPKGPQSSLEIQKEVPKDVLTPEQLNAAHIKIVNSLSTELFLRPNALKDFKIFRDAKEGRIDQAIVILLDTSEINWKTSNFMPQEGKEIYQAMRAAPGESEREGYFYQIMTIEQTLAHWKYILAENGPFYPPPPPGSVGNADLSSAQKVKEQIEKSEALLKKLKEEGPPKLTPSQQKSEETKWSAWGQIMHTSDIARQLDYLDPRYQNDRLQRAKNAIKKYGDNTVVIFLAVGPGVEPKPEQSFPSPDRFPTHMGNQEGYFIDSNTPGQVLRHELGHWKRVAENPNEKRKYGLFYSETLADAQSIASIVNAFAKGEEQGDSSGYSLVFRNRFGVTITANPKRESVPTI